MAYNDTENPFSRLGEKYSRGQYGELFLSFVLNHCIGDNEMDV